MPVRFFFYFVLASRKMLICYNALYFNTDWEPLLQTVIPFYHFLDECLKEGVCVPPPKRNSLKVQIGFANMQLERMLCWRNYFTPDVRLRHSGSIFKSDRLLESLATSSMRNL